jgi:BTB/POZ domain
MDQPPAKKAKRAHDQRPSCPADGLAVSSAAFERAALSDLQHRIWIGRSMKEEFWDLLLKTDDGHQILCSKKDLASFSGYFYRLFSNGKLAKCKKLQIRSHEICGVNLEILISLHYSREKV